MGDAPNMVEVPDDALAELMNGRRSLRRSKRRLALIACREMIRRREVELGLRRETVGEALKHWWRDTDARINDFQVFCG